MSKGKLDALRCLLKQRGISGYIVSNADPHASEFVTEYYRRREKLTGFTGSAGVALVTANHSLLWTDGRYKTQAEKQLSAPWRFNIQKISGALGIIREIIRWIECHVHEILSSESKDQSEHSFCTIAVDAAVISVEEAQAFKRSSVIRLIPLQESLIDCLFEETRRGQKDTKSDLLQITTLPLSVTGATICEKIRKGVDALSCEGLGGYLFSDLSDIAWLLNLRGINDVPNSGVFRSYAMLLPKEHHAGKWKTWSLYIFSDLYYTLLDDPKRDIFPDFPSIKTVANTKIHFLATDGNFIEIYPYKDLCLWLKASMSFFDSTKPIGYGPNINFELYNVLKGLKSDPNDCFVCLPSCVTYFRNFKNDSEIDGFRKCHVIDAIAVVRYLHWLEKSLREGELVTESIGAKQLLAFRKESGEFLQTSFDTISAAGRNGAIIHYSPDDSSSADAEIKLGEMYLVDSGGHYTCGTTDITRTTYIGNDRASQQQKEVYTRVLKGLIAVHMAVFPVSYSNAASGHLDALSRSSLWSVGLDYPHSCGHGVGHGLLVHEGPLGIRKASPVQTSDFPSKYQHFAKKYLDKSLKHGAILSNEPGCYIPGKFGVRIENIVCVTESNVEPLISEDYMMSERNTVPSMKLENLTLVPFCRALIANALMTPDEITWVNTYYAKILATLGPELRNLGFLEAENWLQKECEAL